MKTAHFSDVRRRAMELATNLRVHPGKPAEIEPVGIGLWPVLLRGTT